ncbi:MAG: RHS repeat-associated core domain-containing protein [Vampirovibrionales bacterium]|nr:RHS repeat-associated core domain-containing protein [Vampirovibrionales bacterium]
MLKNGAGIDEPLTITNSSTTQTYLGDHLRSTAWLSDADGAFQTRYDYSGYGKPEGSLPNPSATNSLTYTAREDDGTGLMYYRARYYDPSLEIFISDDPLGDGQRYVGGNPLRWVDPFGLQADAIFINSNKSPKDRRLYYSAKNIKNSSKSYMIVVHSDGRKLFVPLKTPVLGSNGERIYYKGISVEEFYSKYIKGNRNIGIQDVIILQACHAGRGGDDSIAKNLQNYLE